MIPFVILKLDKAYELRFDMSASIRYQQLTGKSIYDINEGELETVIDVLWAILIKENKQLTREDVIALIDEHSRPVDVITAVGQAVKAAYAIKGGQKNATPTAVR